MTFVIVKNGVQSLIGLPSIRKLGILQQALAVEAALPNDVKEFKIYLKDWGSYLATSQ